MYSLPIHKFIPGQMLLVLDYLGLLVVLDYIEIRMKHTVLVLATHELNFITPITNPPPPFYIFLSTYLFCTVDMNCTRTCKCFKRTLIPFFFQLFHHAKHFAIERIYTMETQSSISNHQVSYMYVDLFVYNHIDQNWVTSYTIQTLRVTPLVYVNSTWRPVPHCNY